MARLVRVRTTLGASYVATCGWHSVDAVSAARWRDIAATAVAAFATIAFAQVYNDIRDRRLDRLGKPDRPLPSGAVGLAAARVLAGSAVVVALAAATVAGPAAVGLTALALLIGVLYSTRLKSTVLWGNAAVAATCAAMHLYGPVTTGAVTARTVAGFSLVFLLILGSEVLKTGEDLESDAQAGITTLATARGPRACATAIAWTTAALVACCALTVLVIPFSEIGFLLLGMAPCTAAAAATCATLRRCRPASAQALAAANRHWRRGWRISILGLAFI
jgi:4-hydroxybenzoate polyprenyltransferase